MWRVLDGEEKFQLERVRESFNVPDRVLNEIPALDCIESTAKSSYAKITFGNRGMLRERIRFYQCFISFCNTWALPMVLENRKCWLC